MSGHNAFDGVRVFSTSRPDERTRIGDNVTAWLDAGAGELVDYVVRQSSDQSHHCFTIILFYRNR